MSAQCIIALIGWHRLCDESLFFKRQKNSSVVAKEKKIDLTIQKVIQNIHVHIRQICQMTQMTHMCHMSQILNQNLCIKIRRRSTNQQKQYQCQSMEQIGRKWLFMAKFLSSGITSHYISNVVVTVQIHTFDVTHSCVFVRLKSTFSSLYMKSSKELSSTRLMR